MGIASTALRKADYAAIRVRSLPRQCKQKLQAIYLDFARFGFYGESAESFVRGAVPSPSAHMGASIPSKMEPCFLNQEDWNDFVSHL